MGRILNKQNSSNKEQGVGRFKEVFFISQIGIAFFLLISLLTYHATDPSWSHASTAPAQNAAGAFGAWMADIVFVALGDISYGLPAGLLVLAWLPMRNRKLTAPASPWVKALGFSMVFIALSSLAALYVHPQQSSLPAGPGGIIGDLTSGWMLHTFNLMGSTVLFLVVLFSGLTLSLGVSWLQLVDGVGMGCIWLCQRSWQGVRQLGAHIAEFFHSVRERRAVEAREASPVIEAPLKKVERQIHMKEPIAVEPPVANTPPPPPKPKQTPEEEEASFMAAAPIIPVAKKANAPKTGVKISERAPRKQLKKQGATNTLLDVNLLNMPKPTLEPQLTKDELEYMSKEVEQRLLDFGIEVQVVAVHPGPVITRFELDLAPGLKASRISGLATDLARSLSAISVRIVEVIPGKSVVGLELPNKHREIVYLREVLSARQYQHAKSPISLALGKDIAGHPVVVDLAKMPHLLVAGTTGSGKSVGLNAMLLSLLYKATPEEVRMIMVDPKMLELSIYEGIPHLLTPVVTDMKEAANALRWCVAEMERRYRLMAAEGVRNLAGFNDKVKAAKEAGKPLKAPAWYSGNGEEMDLEPLPLIVVVVDEFADMIMVVGKKVEQLIARIAQKARAAGIHLILATQRPSVNVITGLIKANVPTRIAFQVSSKIDSRTILDQQGAQQLLGHGDMLYLAPGAGIPVRVHGAFVADEEVHRVVGEWKKVGEPEYLDLHFDTGNETVNKDPLLQSEEDGEKDEMYDQAVQIVMDTRRASISNIQRRLRIGYNRAARLVETMEEAGVVGPMESNGTREVLVPSRQE